jgi:hypothetical protein
MKQSPLTFVRLDVTTEDIEEMYDRYDSGMADHTTANAVCVALGKMLRSEYHPQIVSSSSHFGCRLNVGTEHFSLPMDLYWWLDKSSKGCVPAPTSFLIALPEEIFAGQSPAEDAVEEAIAA